MIGTYLGEYAMTYNPTRHGKPGLGATKGAAKWYILYIYLLREKTVQACFKAGRWAVKMLSWIQTWLHLYQEGIGDSRYDYHDQNDLGIRLIDAS